MVGSDEKLAKMNLHTKLRFQAIHIPAASQVSSIKTQDISTRQQHTYIIMRLILRVDRVDHLSMTLTMMQSAFTPVQLQVL